MLDQTASFTHKPNGGSCSATGGKEIINDHHELPIWNCARIKLQTVTSGGYYRSK